jgi:hypothetical protein
MPSLLGILKDEGLIGGGGKAGASTGGVSSSSSPAAGASGSAAVPGGTAVAGTNGVGSYLPGQRLSSLAGMLKSAQQVRDQVLADSWSLINPIMPCNTGV